MATFYFPPIPLIRRNAILRSLAACGATSPETARPLTEIGLINPHGFPNITRRLVSRGVIHQTPDGRYYI